MGNAIITFFMPFDPAPCDKKSFRTSDPLSAFQEGLGTRLIELVSVCNDTSRDMSHAPGTRPLPVHVIVAETEYSLLI